MPIELVTKADLDAFRRNIVSDIEKLLKNIISKDQYLFATPGLNSRPIYKMGEICALFGVTRQTIYDWIKHGKLKPKKIRSRVYFLAADINQLIEEEKNK